MKISRESTTQAITNEVLAERIFSLGGDINRRFAETSSSLEKINEKLSHEYVTRREFQPILWITYGMVGLISTGFIGALIALVWKSSISLL